MGTFQSFIPYVDMINDIAKDSKSVVQRLQRFRATEELILVTYEIRAFNSTIDRMDAIDVVQKNVPLLRLNNSS